ncbi:MAG: sulfurtransferase [Thermoplasmata archaeon]
MNKDGKSPIVSADWLKTNMKNPFLVPADCRFNLMDHAYGLRSYTSGHIPGAVFFDMEKDLSSPDKSFGRHPIPALDDFRKVLEGRGISKESIVVAYDDDGSGAARLWFLLEYFSLANGYVLDGGLNAWLKAGGDVTTIVPERKSSSVRLKAKKYMIVEKEAIESNSSPFSLIDARSPDRYAGEYEPIDRIPGHIPTAKNIFWKNVLNEDGTYKTPEQIRSIFKEVGKNPVLYCGSGVTSCVNYIAMRIAGIEPKLYPGGWSHWVKTIPEQ